MISTVLSLYEDPNVFNRFCDFILCNRFQTYSLHIVWNNEAYYGQITLTGKITTGSNEKYESLADWYSDYSGLPHTDPEVSNIKVLRNIYVTKRVTLYEIMNGITLIEATQFKDTKFYANALFLWIYRYLHNSNVQNDYSRSVEYLLQWNSTSYLVCTNKIKLVKETANTDKVDHLLTAFRENTLQDAYVIWRNQRFNMFGTSESEPVSDRGAVGTVDAVGADSRASNGTSSVSLEALQARIRHLETTGIQKIDAVADAVKQLAINETFTMVQQMREQLESMQNYYEQLQAELNQANQTIQYLQSEVEALKQAPARALTPEPVPEKSAPAPAPALTYATAVHPVYPTNDPIPITWYSPAHNGTYQLIPVQPYQYVQA